MLKASEEEKGVEEHGRQSCNAWHDNSDDDYIKVDFSDASFIQ